MSIAANDPPHERMCHLVLSFPVMRYKNPAFRDAKGKWSAVVFRKWAKNNAYSHGEILVVRFILHVWTGGRRIGGLKRFDLFEALGVWSEDNRAAFIAWASNPWWP